MTKSDRTPDARVFLFLQGPHGPFFAQMARRLTERGHSCLRAAFNPGDRLFWPRQLHRVDITCDLETWPQELARLLERHRVTDIVLYGDMRPLHRMALQLAETQGIETHVFEEGYVRPHWITYERGPANGRSSSMRMSLGEMRACLDEFPEMPPPADRWGDLRQHVAFGALYHAAIMVGGLGASPAPPRHRALSVWTEFRLYFQLLALMPVISLERWLATATLLRRPVPFHLVLLQLEHDPNFQIHGPYASMADFVAETIRDFAAHAPDTHRLVFKAHPLESGQLPLRRLIRTHAHSEGIADRVRFLNGGKLARVLEHAASLVTINSTGAHQALWRGLPVKAMGRAVYARDGITDNRPLGPFFAAPRPPDQAAYKVLRSYLLRTSQIDGSYYSSGGRALVLRRLLPLMLDLKVKNDAVEDKTAAVTQHLSIVQNRAEGKF